MSIPTVEKVPGATRRFWMQCAGRLEEGEVLTAISAIEITPDTVPPLTYTAQTVAGTVAQFKLVGGLTNTKYTVKVTYVTSLDNIDIGTGYVQVEEEDE